MSRFVRQAHRWLAVIFTLAVIAVMASFAMGSTVEWIVYAPLPPLLLMLLSGIYLFVLPYTRKSQS